MKRSVFAIATGLALPLLGAFAAPAFAGVTFVPPVLTITNAPTVFTVNQPGTVTYTLTQTSRNGEIDEEYVVTANIPASFTITGHDSGNFDECNTEGQVVTCDLDAAIGPDEDSTTASFAVEVTPTQVGTFPATGTFTYDVGGQPTVRKAGRGRSADLTRTPNFTTPTVTNNIQVVGPSTSTPTPTATPSSAPSKTSQPSASPTHKVTHKPTHKATVRATTTTTASAQTLPNTGSSDLGWLAVLGSAMVVVGSGAVTLARRRRPTPGRHQ